MHLHIFKLKDWKATFKGIIDAEMLDKCTNIVKATNMYQKLLDENNGNGYLLTVGDKPHCIAYWDSARDLELNGKAELICIHSLLNNWHKGFGSKMMDVVLEDIKKSGYYEVVLWVFRDNLRARAFYEKEWVCVKRCYKTSF